MTAFSVFMNSAASVPYTMRWSHVRLTVICRSTPMRPAASAVTVGLLLPTAMMPVVPAHDSAYDAFDCSVGDKKLHCLLTHMRRMKHLKLGDFSAASRKQ